MSIKTLKLYKEQKRGKTDEKEASYLIRQADRSLQRGQKRERRAWTSGKAGQKQERGKVT